MKQVAQCALWGVQYNIFFSNVSVFNDIALHQGDTGKLIYDIDFNTTLNTGIEVYNGHESTNYYLQSIFIFYEIGTVKSNCIFLIEYIMINSVFIFLPRQNDIKL